MKSFCVNRMCLDYGHVRQHRECQGEGQPLRSPQDKYDGEDWILQVNCILQSTYNQKFAGFIKFTLH